MCKSCFVNLISINIFFFYFSGSTYPKASKNTARPIQFLRWRLQPWPEVCSPSTETTSGRSGPTTKRWTCGAARTWKCPSESGSAEELSKLCLVVGSVISSEAFTLTPSRATKTHTVSTPPELSKSGWTSKSNLFFFCILTMPFLKE